MFGGSRTKNFRVSVALQSPRGKPKMSKRGHFRRGNNDRGLGSNFEPIGATMYHEDNVLVVDYSSKTSASERSVEVARPLPSTSAATAAESKRNRLYDPISTIASRFHSEQINQSRHTHSEQKSESISSVPTTSKQELHVTQKPNEGREVVFRKVRPTIRPLRQPITFKVQERVTTVPKPTNAFAEKSGDFVVRKGFQMGKALEIYPSQSRVPPWMKDQRVINTANRKMITVGETETKSAAVNATDRKRITTVETEAISGVVNAMDRKRITTGETETRSTVGNATDRKRITTGETEAKSTVGNATNWKRITTGETEAKSTVGNATNWKRITTGETETKSAVGNATDRKRITAGEAETDPRTANGSDRKRVTTGEAETPTTTVPHVHKSETLTVIIPQKRTPLVQSKPVTPLNKTDPQPLPTKPLIFPNGADKSTSASKNVMPVKTQPVAEKRAAVASTSKGELEAVSDDDLDEEPCAEKVVDPPVIKCSDSDDTIIPYSDECVLSNMYECRRLLIHERQYSSTEQFYMWSKAMFCKDYKAANAILYLKDPKMIRQVGSQLKNLNVEQWMRFSWKVRMKGAMAKFKQNRRMRYQLFRTIGCILAEASDDDAYWGIGLSKDDPDVADPSKWRGSNVMGEVLMQIRDVLQGDPIYSNEVKQAKQNLLRSQ